MLRPMREQKGSMRSPQRWLEIVTQDTPIGFSGVSRKLFLDRLSAGSELQGFRDASRNEGRAVTAHLCDLPYKRGRDMSDIGRCGQEHGSDFRRERPVHSGHLHFIVQIGTIAQAANDDVGSHFPGGVHGKAAECHHVKAVAHPEEGSCLRIEVEAEAVRRRRRRLRRCRDSTISSTG